MKRAITGITIQVEGKTVTMFLTYNDNVNDYSFNNYHSVEDAVNSVLKNKDPYFPLKTDFYRILKIKGNKTLSDKKVSFYSHINSPYIDPMSDCF